MMTKNTDKKLEKVIDLLYQFTNKTHDKPAQETREKFEEQSKKLTEIEVKMQKFDLVDVKIDNINKMITDFIKICNENEEKYVTKDSLKAELSTFKVYFSIIGIVAVTLLNFLVDYIKTK